MKLRLIAVLTLFVALVCVASAGAAPGGNGNGATVTPFTLAYPDNLATCSGNRIQKDGRNSFIKDVETCATIIDFYAPGTYSLSDPSSPAYGWCSDFDGFSTCNLAIAGTLTVSYNGGGNYTWKIVAYYSQP